METGRNLERWQYWRDVMRKQQDSGLTVAEFCRVNKVPSASFFSWRKKLAAADRDSSGAPERDANAAAAVRDQFVPIELPMWTQNTVNFEIVAPDGYRIVVPTKFQTESLREILRLLQEIASC